MSAGRSVEQDEADIEKSLSFAAPIGPAGLPVNPIGVKFHVRSEGSSEPRFDEFARERGLVGGNCLVSTPVAV
jgi:hypothetical protein